MKTSLFLIFGFVLSFPLMACAQDNNTYIMAMAKKQANKVIDECWAVSQDDRDSGVTLRMREGTLVTANCLRDHIVSLSKDVLFKNNAEQQANIETSLNELMQHAGRIYWDLNNDHDVCKESSCGTMYTVIHNMSVARMLEKIVTDFYQQIAEYNYHYKFFDE